MTISGNFTASGSGAHTLGELSFTGSTMTSSGSTVTIDDALTVTGTITASRIEPASGAFSFGNNNIETGGTIYTSSGLIFEGATQDDFETALNVVDPTADRTILLPDASGTILVTGSTGDISGTMIANDTVSEANMADDAIGQDQLKSVVELKILNSSGTVVKTLFGAGA